MVFLPFNWGWENLFIRLWRSHTGHEILEGVWQYCVQVTERKTGVGACIKEGRDHWAFAFGLAWTGALCPFTTFSYTYFCTCLNGTLRPFTAFNYTYINYTFRPFQYLYAFGLAWGGALHPFTPFKLHLLLQLLVIYFWFTWGDLQNFRKEIRKKIVTKSDSTHQQWWHQWPSGEFLWTLCTMTFVMQWYFFYSLFIFFFN